MMGAVEKRTTNQDIESGQLAVLALSIDEASSKRRRG